jgi:hypothetical protein
MTLSPGRNTAPDLGYRTVLVIPVMLRPCLCDLWAPFFQAVMRAAAVQRWLPAPDPLAKASARQRSNVAVLIPLHVTTDELSGGNSLATIRSLYARPYRAS